jgi:hypothetical protein
MIKNLKTVRAAIMMGMLIGSIFAMFMPTASAAPQSVVEISHAIGDVQDPIMPLGAQRQIGITIRYSITSVSPALWDAVYGGQLAIINLEVGNTPPWCTAVISPNIVSTNIRSSFQSTNATLTVQIDDTAPAFTGGAIQIIARVDKVAFIEGRETTYDVPFTPGYLPTIKFNAPDTGNFMEIGPGDIANFPVEIENLGNAKTEVTFKVLNTPQGWSPTITSTIVLGTDGTESKETVNFVIQPPFGIGYHNEREVFQVAMKPSYFFNPTLEGKEYVLSFVVRNRGFSTPGFEGVLLILALVSITFIIKKQRK